MDPYLSGIEHLLRTPPAVFATGRIGLVCHPASLTAGGEHSAGALRRYLGDRLAAILGPEHGFLGAAGPGEEVAGFRHPEWGIPVHSLYGDHRKPTPEMLDGLDAVVFDLQDLSVRCYTYVSTLRLVMEACAAQGKTLIVADRPTPFPDQLDGPLLDPAFRSFVGDIATPLVYGMTPAETALWLHERYIKDLDLAVSPMLGYARSPRRGADWGPWVPPSPGIRSWESAWCYPATVFTEALPTLDCDRGGLLPFQVVAAPWIEAGRLATLLDGAPLRGAGFYPVWYRPAGGSYGGETVQGIRIVVEQPEIFRPVEVAVWLLALLQREYGAERLWDAPGARPGFFDQLMGTNRVRLALQAGKDPAEIVNGWTLEREAFEHARSSALLYSVCSAGS